MKNTSPLIVGIVLIIGLFGTSCNAQDPTRRLRAGAIVERNLQEDNFCGREVPATACGRNVDCTGLPSIEIDAPCNDILFDCNYSCSGAGFDFAVFESGKCMCYEDTQCTSTFASQGLQLYALGSETICPKKQREYTQCKDPMRNTNTACSGAVVEGGIIGDTQPYLDALTCSTYCDSQGFDYATVFRAADKGSAAGCYCFAAEQCLRVRGYPDAATFALGSNQCPY